MTTEEILKEAHLRYSTDKKPGFTRKIIKDKFVYFDLEGKEITDQETIDRINKLVIPPAYKNVWICPHKNGYLQATGYDDRGRKQYRYHPNWITFSQQEKFAHMIDFGMHLPEIRKKIRKDLDLPGMPREKVIAAVVWLLENTLIRVGNEEYEKENKSFGLTTLKNRHVDTDDSSQIYFHFKGKSGVYHKVHFRNKRVASIIRQCKELPGQDLFEYKDDDGKIQTVSSSDVNDYLRDITGVDTTAKDFRTWGGTVLAADCFDKCGICDDEKLSKKNIVETIKKVSSHLRNRPATCKKYYIHPTIINAYSSGYVLSSLEEKMKQHTLEEIVGLNECENRVLALLKFMMTEQGKNVSALSK